MVNFTMGYYDNVLEHHGILGQKWGVRRFQNEDGSLTSAGRKRYDTDEDGNYKKLTDKQIENTKNYKRLKRKAEEEGYKQYSSDFWENVYGEKEFNTVNKIQRNAKKEALERYKNGEIAKSPLQEKLSDPKVKAAIAIGATLAVAGIAAYGGYKLKQINNVTTKGLSDKYEKLAKLAFADSAELHGKSLLSEMKAVSAGKDSKAYDIGKDAAKSYKKASDAYNVLGEQLRTKSKSKDYSVKEKVDFIKELKNTASDPNAGYKMYEKVKTQARTVTPEKFTYETFKPAKLEFDKFGYEKFKTAAQANDDLVNDLLKRNGKALGM